MSAERIPVMDDTAVRRAVARMAREIIEKSGGTQGLAVMGIHRRGIQIAALLREEIRTAEGVDVPAGSIDISLYRDDLEEIGPRPIIGGSELPSAGIDGRTIVLVDDVQHTGRTARAAINAPSVGAIPHSTDAAVKSAIPAISSRRWPTRSPSRPALTIRTVIASR